MNGSQLCFFSILIISAFSQANGKYDPNSDIVSNAIDMLQDRAVKNGDFNTLMFTNLLKTGNWRAAGLVSKVLSQNFINQNGNELTIKANMELASLRGKRDACSVKKSHNIRAIKSELKGLTCLDLSGTLMNVSHLVNNTVKTGLLLAFDIANFTTTTINCTVSADKTQCISDSLQSLENDVDVFFPLVGSLVSEMISIIIDIMKDIIGCFHSKSLLETSLRYMINTKCNGESW